MKSAERRRSGGAIRFERQSEPFTVEVWPDRERVRVLPHGELDMATVGRLAAQIDELVANGSRAVVLDLRATSFLDSSGVHLLLEQSAREDAQVTLIDGADPVRRVIDVAGVRRVLRFEVAT
jgi:anti-anti-sigma factor